VADGLGCSARWLSQAADVIRSPVLSEVPTARCASWQVSYHIAFGSCNLDIPINIDTLRSAGYMSPLRSFAGLGHGHLDVHSTLRAVAFRHAVGKPFIVPRRASLRLDKVSATEKVLGQEGAVAIIERILAEVQGTGTHVPSFST
jgi:hypothetical protein